MKKRLTTVSILIIILTSCIPKKNIIYLQDLNNKELTLNSFRTILKHDDLLKIEIRTIDKEVSEIYNPSINQNDPNFAGYLINKDGYIILPSIGSVKAAGYTKEEFIVQLKKILSQYIKNYTVDVRLLNFSVNVTGEVLSPGTIKITGERITLLEALARVGDLTIYGNRKNIKIIRTNGDNIITKTVDITNSDFMNSEFYYLTQNDIVYVEPRRQKADSIAIGPNITTTIQILSGVISLYLSYIIIKK